MSYVTSPTSTPKATIVGHIVRQESSPALWGKDTFHNPLGSDPGVQPPGVATGEAVDLTSSDDQDFPRFERHLNETRLCCLPLDSYQSACCCLCSALPCMWPAWLGACRGLTNRNEAVFYLGGQPYAHASAPQKMYLCVNPVLDMHKYSKNQKMVNLDEVKAADADGSPIQLSGVVTYAVGDPWRYLSSHDAETWLRNQGLVVMKEVASRYAYDAAPGQVSLRARSSRNVVVQCLKSELQQRVQNVGLKIKSFEFTDMHYAKEVAAQMLVQQQAKATLNARRIIVDGAVSIVTSTVEKLEDVGIGFTPAQKADLVRSLLVMSVSDAPAQTTVAV